MTAQPSKAPPAGGDSRQRVLSWILLAGFLLVAGIARGVYAAPHGVGPSPTFQFLSTLGAMAFLWCWFAAQMTPHRPGLAMDMGLFIALLWFILVPYYMWRYERWRGLFKAACVFGIYALSWVLTVIVYLALV